MKTLRSDQSQAIEDLREAMREPATPGEPAPNRLVLQGPTGMGKTVIIADIVARARARGKKVLITVPAISLVDQTVIAINAQGIDDVGVIQAAHPMTDWSKPVQVASVQTLVRRWREQKMPEADIVLVDEVHRMFELFSNWMPSKQWANVPFIGFSATPWTTGLGMLYKKLIPCSSISKLIEDKVLVRFRTFAPDAPDLTGVRHQGDEFVTADLEEVMRPKKLVANIVETWKELAAGRPTVAFCCSRGHADQLCEEFVAAGVGAGYLDCDTALSDRNAVRQQMLRGDIKVVCNVDVVGLGVDWPEVSCIIYARPTMSDMRFVQNIGRGLRSCEGKQDLLILDHSTTTSRLGFVDDIYGYHNELEDGKIKPPAKVVALPKECPSCHLMKPPRAAVCPHCGHTVEEHADPVPVERGTLREIKEKIDPFKQLRERLPDRSHVFGQLTWFCQKKGYKPGWVNMKFNEIYGVKFPRSLRYEDKIDAPCPELLVYIYESNKNFVRQQYAIRSSMESKAARNGHNGHSNGHSNGHGEHDSGALSEREQAMVDRVAEQTKFIEGTLMTKQDFDDFR